MWQLGDLSRKNKKVMHLRPSMTLEFATTTALQSGSLPWLPCTLLVSLAISHLGDFYEFPEPKLVLRVTEKMVKWLGMNMNCYDHYDQCYTVWCCGIHLTSVAWTNHWWSTCWPASWLARDEDSISLYLFSIWLSDVFCHSKVKKGEKAVDTKTIEAVAQALPPYW